MAMSDKKLPSELGIDRFIDVLHYFNRKVPGAVFSN